MEFFVALVQDTTERLQTDEAVAAVQHIVADTHPASEVVAGIRRFLQRGKAQRAPVDLHVCVSEVARMLEAEAGARHVRL